MHCVYVGIFLQFNVIDTDYILIYFFNTPKTKEYFRTPNVK